MTTDQLRIFAPCGMLGYGIPERSFERGMSQNPDVLAVDAGSIDPGPYYLGSGVSFTNRAMVKRDLRLILRAAYERNLQVVIGSAGGGGARPHVLWLLEIIDEVNEECGLHFPTAVVLSDVERELLKRKIRQGKVSRFEQERELTTEEIDRSSHIVAQMGTEPIVEALRRAQLVVCGRASDPAVMAAPALARGFPIAPAMHLGKILECGAAAAYPRHGTDGLLGTLFHDGFLVEPSSPDQVCTVESVAAHTLYERADPFQSRWPGGVLDLSKSNFHQYDERTVKITGSQYHANDSYLVKLEGAAHYGYRTIAIAGARDPILCENFDVYEQNLRERLSQVVAPLEEYVDYQLCLHVYGRDGTMGHSEPRDRVEGHEVGVVLEVVGRTEAISRQVLATSRSVALHSTYPGRKAIAGNLAFPISPSDIGVGDAYEFNVYHLVELDQPDEIFPIFYEQETSALIQTLSELDAAVVAG